MDDRTTCALVLSAIAMKGRRDLRSLVQTMDYLNRANPSADEFEVAIRRLLGGGLIVEGAPMSFGLTGSGRAAWKQTGRGGVIDRFVTLARSIPLSEPDPWTLDREAYAAAEADYFGSA